MVSICPLYMPINNCRVREDNAELLMHIQVVGPQSETLCHPCHQGLMTNIRRNTMGEGMLGHIKKCRARDPPALDSHT